MVDKSHRRGESRNSLFEKKKSAFSVLFLYDSSYFTQILSVNASTKALETALHNKDAATAKDAALETIRTGRDIITEWLDATRGHTVENNEIFAKVRYYFIVRKAYRISCSTHANTRRNFTKIWRRLMCARPMC